MVWLSVLQNQERIHSYQGLFTFRWTNTMYIQLFVVNCIYGPILGSIKVPLFVISLFLGRRESKQNEMMHQSMQAMHPVNRCNASDQPMQCIQSVRALRPVSPCNASSEAVQCIQPLWEMHPVYHRIACSSSRQYVQVQSTRAMLSVYPRNAPSPSSYPSIHASILPIYI